MAVPTQGKDFQSKRQNTIGIIYFKGSVQKGDIASINIYRPKTP